MGDLIYPAIPDPISTVDSLLETTRALKEAVELLNGARAGMGTAKAITATDLAFVFGNPTLPPGTAPPPGGGVGGIVSNPAIVAARAAAQRALLELRNALENASNDLNNSQEAALAEFQALLGTETQLRIDGDNALQSQVDAIILTNDEGAIAAIATETALRIAADEALAGQIETVQAGVDGNAAAITNEALARAQQDEALAIQINSITAIASGQHVFVQSTPPVGSASAPLTVGDIWIDTAHGNLLKVWDGAAWTDRQDEQIDINAAAIVTEQTVRANADEVIAQDITTIIGRVDDADAAITNEALLRVQGDEAIAGTVSTLSTTVADNTVAITNEQIARADADVAIGNQLTTLEAEVGSNQATVTNELTALADADEAFAIELNEVSTTVDGHTATITQHSASLNGLLAEYSLTLNVNGHITGFQINSSTTAPSQFIVQADQFKIVSAAGGTLHQPFSVIGPDTFINRVIVNQEIISSNYAQDGSGNPTLGFRAGSDGLLRAYDARFVNVKSVGGTFDTGTFINLSAMDAVFVDLAARGATFTERPVIIEQPNFRNGVPEGQVFTRWSGNGPTNWSPTLAWGSMTVSMHRSPDSIFAQFTQVDGSSNSLIAYGQYFVPPGARLPPVIVGDLTGNVNNIEWRDDGTVWRIQYSGSGAVSASWQALGKWMYDVERDPLNLGRLNKMIAGLGFTRIVQPLRIPEKLANGTTDVTSVSFKVWGAGGATDDSSATGGPGGYVAGTFAVGSRTSTTHLIKRGDMLKLIVGEGGKSKQADVVFGFGGRGQAQDRRSGGGGMSGVFLYDVSIANALLIAGGGGGGENGSDGGSGGHSTTSGGNGVVGADHLIFTGLPWSSGRAGGGGGRVGGGYLSAAPSGGRGGTNFVRTGTGITGTSNLFSAAGVTTPPNSGDADRVANQSSLCSDILIGAGKNVADTFQQGGHGLIVVTFA